MILLHVDDLLIFGTPEFLKEIEVKVRKDYQVGSLMTNDAMFCGQRVKKQGQVIVVDQDRAIEEISEIPLDNYKSLLDKDRCPPELHTQYRQVLGQLN